MRRPWWFRLVAALCGIWLVLVVGEPGVVHACPTHGGTASAATSVQSGHAMAGHSMASAHAAQDARGATAPAHEHQGCTCIGCCIGGTAIAPLRAAPVVLASIVATPTGVAIASAALLPRPGPQHAQPYPTGPPRA